jgi:(1->4)-alpha-D-glucan 1-alpha-D-glucosylmutase
LEEKASQTIASILHDASAGRPLPLASYRLQLNSKFRFRDVQALIPYWHELGISHLYVSPILQACAGSAHGYDVCQFDRINSELGGEDELDRLGMELQRHGIGIILDIVPNHMGISDPCNAWWMDVLENGSSSPYASFFDIDWNPVKEELRGKILLPILEDQYGNVLESGKIRLRFENGSFFLTCAGTVLPVAPGTYSFILTHRFEDLSKSMDADDPALQEFQSILTALNYLPARTEQEAEKIAERSREKEIIKRRLASLCESSAEIRNSIEDTLTQFNGMAGRPGSFDHLDALIAMQVYRPAFWKVAAEEINYRRFFDINNLAAVRMEDPEVFKAAHALIFELLCRWPFTGLRIDHADGLRDPASYLRQIQCGYIQKMLQTNTAGHISAAGIDVTLSDWLAGQFEAAEKPAAFRPVYVVVEKILSENECLPENWAAYGTTGYDFLNKASGIFVHCSGENEFTKIYADFTGTHQRYGSLIHSTKKMMMLVSLAAEIYALSHQLDRISECNRSYRDFTLDSLTFAIREIIASLGIYRTYIAGPESVSERDRAYIEAAVSDAKRRNPRTVESLFDFIRNTLLLRNLDVFPEAERAALLQWTMKFQQITGSVMAKGIEDTAFYVYNRLISLNEVGGYPGHFGNSVADFHRHNDSHSRHWPYSMLAGTTHDTKRSEDVRARIHVLSEIPEEWAERIQRWRDTNAPYKTLVDGEPAPDANDEYLFYQTLLGAWPMKEPNRQLNASAAASDSFRERMAAYMHKAIKEAKVHTSWVNPNRDYDDAVEEFVMNVLRTDRQDGFWEDFGSFQKRISFYGKYNSLSQLLLKLTSPGIPDTYQGSELWDLRLVDPDNRRPVDYGIRIAYLEDLKARIGRQENEGTPASAWISLAKELLKTSDDGRIKLYTLYRTLLFRQSDPDLFTVGEYLPLDAAGIKKENICSFGRRMGSHIVLVAVPRLPVGLTDGIEREPLGEIVWQGTWLILPKEWSNHRYRNLFTGEVLSVGKRPEYALLPLSAVFQCFPVALLERLE